MQYFNKNAESVNPSSGPLIHRVLPIEPRLSLISLCTKKVKSTPEIYLDILFLPKVEQDIPFRNAHWGLQDNYELCFC